MPASSATPLRAGDWVYKAEGGRNLVLSYGGEGQGFAGHVLRLSKRRCVAHGHGCGGGGGRGTCGGEVESVGEGKESGVEVAACAGGNGDAEAETEVETETEAEAEAEAEGSSSKVGPGSPGKETGCEESFRYMKETFSPIVRKDLLFMGRLVAVGAHFLSELASICQPMRPSQRLSLEIDTEARSGWLMPDLSTLPRIKSGVVAVEIKPKSCVLPQAHQVCQEHACKAEVSAYAMMQHWKLSKVLSYPLLFSLPPFVHNIITLRFRSNTPTPFLLRRARWGACRTTIPPTSFLVTKRECKLRFGHSSTIPRII
jgi:hypothetical protein